MLCRQLVNEQIPKRQEQLLTTYGPSGSPALLPGPQPSDVPLSIGRVDTSSASDQQFVEVLNNNSYAIDVSNWQLTGSARVTIKPGFICPSR